jgi:hypothetical protein
MTGDRGHEKVTYIMVFPFEKPYALGLPPENQGVVL